MKNKLTREKKELIFGIVGIIALIIVIGLALFNKKNTDEKKTKTSTENISSSNQKKDSETESIQETTIVTVNNQSQQETTVNNEETTTATQKIDVLPNHSEHSATLEDIQNTETKVVFLTFDDGPSNLTPQYLDVLKEYGVNATFFVTYQPDLSDIYKRSVSEGNKLQVHTATHDYNKIYSSVDNYIADFNQVYDFIKTTTGEEPDCYRFPGGSNNSYGKGITKEIAAALNQKGYSFFDWNVSVGDGNANATHDSIIQKVENEAANKTKIVMLAHDSGSKTETLSALPELIQYFIDNNYKFGVIDKNVNANIAQFIKWN